MVKELLDKGVAVAVGKESEAYANGGIAIGIGGGKACTGGNRSSPPVPAWAESLVAAASGPWEVVAVGTDKYTWDCWRDILKDYSSPSTRGRLLRDLVDDSRVVGIHTETQEGKWPRFWLKNQWNEVYRIDYVVVDNNEIAAHAILI